MAVVCAPKSGEPGRTSHTTRVPARCVLRIVSLVCCPEGVVSYSELKAKLQPHAVSKQLHKLRTGAQLRRGSQVVCALGKLDMRPGAPSVQVQLKKIVKANMMRLTDLLKKWDLDGNGTVDRKEFAEAVAALGCNAPREEIDGLFATFDKDGSGQIDYQEIHLHLR